MINKKLLTTTAIASLMVASSAFAQAVTSKFTGSSLALTGSYISAQNKIEHAFESYNTTNDIGGIYIGSLSKSTVVPNSSSALLVLMVTCATAAIEASASPLKPMVLMANKSSMAFILLVAWR